MAVNFGGGSQQVAARQRLMGPPPQGMVANLAARLEVLEAEGLSDAELFGEIQKTLPAGNTTIGDENDGGNTGRLGDDDGAQAQPSLFPLAPPRGWYGGNRLGAAGLLLLLSEWREGEDRYTPYASLARQHRSPGSHGASGGDDGNPRSPVAVPTVWNHRDGLGGARGPGRRWPMEPPRHGRWGLGAGIHLRDDLSIDALDQVVRGGIMITERTGPVLAPF